MLASSLFLLVQPAHALDRCMDRLNAFAEEWRSIAVPGPPPADVTRSTETHGYIAQEFWYMRSQLRLALRLCNERKEHEAMLHMDVVQAC